jgi:hypothetical protein
MTLITPKSKTIFDGAFIWDGMSPSERERLWRAGIHWHERAMAAKQEREREVAFRRRSVRPAAPVIEETQPNYPTEATTPLNIKDIARGVLDLLLHDADLRATARIILDIERPN